MELGMHLWCGADARQSDGGSAFNQYRAGIAQVRGSGAPLIELLTFLCVAAIVVQMGAAFLGKLTMVMQRTLFTGEKSATQRLSALCLLLACCSGVAAAGTKPEDIVSQHLNSIGTAEVRAAVKSRDIQ